MYSFEGGYPVGPLVFVVAREDPSSPNSPHILYIGRSESSALDLERHPLCAEMAAAGANLVGLCVELDLRRRYMIEADLFHRFDPPLNGRLPDDPV
jgi:hypothetical protein